MRIDKFLYLPFGIAYPSGSHWVLLRTNHGVELKEFFNSMGFEVELLEDHCYTSFKLCWLLLIMRKNLHIIGVK